MEVHGFRWPDSGALSVRFKMFVRFVASPIATVANEKSSQYGLWIEKNQKKLEEAKLNYLNTDRNSVLSMCSRCSLRELLLVCDPNCIL